MIVKGQVPKGRLRAIVTDLERLQGNADAIRRVEDAVQLLKTLGRTVGKG
jgi:hypothetical protein